MEIFQSALVDREGMGISSAEAFDAKAVKLLDQSWENALNDGNRSVVEKLVHRDFVWVHNQAEMIQHSKTHFLQFFDSAFAHLASRPKSMRLGERNQRDVSVLIDSGTAVVFGFTEVKRPGGDVNQPDHRPLLVFHFMRTYVKSDNQTLLIANHTMLLEENGSVG